MAKGKYQEWLTAEGLAKIERWKRHGLTNEQIAANMGICEATFYKWQEEHKEFSEAIKKGLEVIVCELENALIKRAKGYEVTESNSFYDRDGNEIKRETVRHVPPDTTALIFALKNMDSANWRDRKETALSGAVDTTPKEINVNFVKADSNGL